MADSPPKLKAVKAEITCIIPVVSGKNPTPIAPRPARVKKGRYESRIKCTLNEVGANYQR